MLKKYLVRFVAADQGQDLIEYTLLVALIAIGCAVALGSLQSNLRNVLTGTGSTISNISNSTP